MVWAHLEMCSRCGARLHAGWGVCAWPKTEGIHLTGTCEKWVQVGTDALKEAFQDAGDIASAVVMRDQAGTSRGFGFVNFEKPEAADKAVADFHNAPHTRGTWLVGFHH